MLVAKVGEAFQLQSREAGQSGELSKDLTEPLCPANRAAVNIYASTLMGNPSITWPTYNSLASATSAKQNTQFWYSNSFRLRVAC